MKKKFEAMIWDLMEQYSKELHIPNMWEKPIVKFAAANDPKFEELRELVVSEHYLPTDYLAGAVTVLSYFLPFKREIPQTNAEGVECSKVWADAYLITNDMFGFINEHLVGYIRAIGYEAAIPQNAGMISLENPKSRWSQRHVAYIAGHGTFGLNNMLISDKGSVGRYNSIVTTLATDADVIPTEERCLYKKNGSCGLCVKRCMTGALTTDGFDRFKCLAMCLENEKKYPGADVCGKCTVELPCSHIESVMV